MVDIISIVGLVAAFASSDKDLEDKEDERFIIAYDRTLHHIVNHLDHIWCQ